MFDVKLAQKDGLGHKNNCQLSLSPETNEHQLGTTRFKAGFARNTSEYRMANEFRLRSSIYFCTSCAL